MPKAVVCVQHCQVSDGLVSVEVGVSTDTGDVNLSTSFNVNFASSTNQLTSDIKAKVRDVLIGYGVVLAVNDVVLFGGPV